MSELEKLIKNSGFDTSTNEFDDAVTNKAYLMINVASNLDMTVCDFEKSMWELNLAIKEAKELAKSRAKI